METGRECSLCDLPLGMNCSEMAGNPCVEMVLRASSRWTSWKLIRHKCRLQETLRLPMLAVPGQSRAGKASSSTGTTPKEPGLPLGSWFPPSQPQHSGHSSWLTSKTKGEILHKTLSLKVEVTVVGSQLASICPPACAPRINHTTLAGGEVHLNVNLHLSQI